MPIEKRMTLDGDTLREYTQAEYDQNTKDINDAAVIKAAEDAIRDAFIKDRAEGLAKLEAAGLTPAQAKAVARKDK